MVKSLRLASISIGCCVSLEVERLCRDLVESGRWQYNHAMRLADDLSACGPPVSAQLLVA